VYSRERVPVKNCGCPLFLHNLLCTSTGFERGRSPLSNAVSIVKNGLTCKMLLHTEVIMLTYDFFLTAYST
jgi:hypothetical protein